LKEIKTEYPQGAANLDGPALAKQGVLFLNTCLTVRQGQPLSHKDIGWTGFTSAVIRNLANQGGKAFVLWGTHAKTLFEAAVAGNTTDKETTTSPEKKSPNLVLRAAHPSPLSAHNGFFGCGHFQKINQWLTTQGLAPIDWRSNE
jgi:uracil-DNA glycosylase